MNILMILPSLSYRGGERIFYTKAKGLAKLGHKVTMVVGRIETGAFKIDKPIKLVTPNKFLNKLFKNDYLFFLGSFFAMFYLAIINSDGIDIIDTESGFALWAGYLVGKIKKIKVVWTVMAVEEKSFLNKIIHFPIADKIDGYNTLAPRTVRIMKNIFNINNVEVIIPAIDDQRFKNKQSLAGKTGKQIILLPATLHPKKNQELAISAIEKLKNAFPNILLVLAGDGIDKTRLENLVSSKKINNYVYFAGVVRGDKIYDYYKSSTLVLVTSNVDNEGLSMTALEALYCKKMPIVSKFAGVAEILENEKIGITFNPTVSELTEKIKYYLQNKPKFEKMLIRGQNWVRHELSAKKYAKKIAGFYREVLQGN